MVLVMMETVVGMAVEMVSVSGGDGGGVFGSNDSDDGSGRVMAVTEKHPI